MTSSNTRQPQKRFWTAQRLTATFIVFALMATIGISSCTSGNPDSTTNANAPATNASTKAPTATNPKAPATNTAPPPATTVNSIPLPSSLLETPLTTIDGKTLKFSDYNGHVVVINLWASWCGPCRVETPELIQMSKDFKARGVEFVGLTTKGNDPEIEPIKEFVSEQQVPYKTVWDDGRFAGPLTQAVRARAVIPQSFVLLRDGSIFKHFEGFNQMQTPKLLREAIEQALNYKG